MTGITSDELIMVKNCCLLPLMLSVVEKQKEEMEQSDAMMKPLYIAALSKLQDTIHADLFQMRKQLKDANIKMWKVEDNVREKSAFKYKFNCRGYDGVFEMLRSLVRAEIAKKFGYYIAKTMNPDDSTK